MTALTRRRFLLSVITGGLAAVIPSVASADDGIERRPYNAVLRLWDCCSDRIEWHTHRTGHHSEGVADRHPVSDGYLRVRLTWDGANTVGSPRIQPDESLAALGITCGISATRDVLSVAIYRHGKRISPNHPCLRGNRKNLWLDGEQRRIGVVA